MIGRLLETSADRARLARRADHRLSVAIREHAYRADVRAQLARLSSGPHDPAPTIPPTAPNGAESETS